MSQFVEHNLRNNFPPHFLISYGFVIFNGGQFFSPFKEIFCQDTCLRFLVIIMNFYSVTIAADTLYLHIFFLLES